MESQSHLDLLEERIKQCLTNRASIRKQILELPNNSSEEINAVKQNLNAQLMELNEQYSQAHDEKYVLLEKLKTAREAKSQATDRKRKDRTEEKGKTAEATSSSAKKEKATAKSTDEEYVKLRFNLTEEGIRNGGMDGVVNKLTSEGVRFGANPWWKIMGEVAYRHTGYVITFLASDMEIIRTHMTQLESVFGYFPKVMDIDRIFPNYVTIRLVPVLDRKRYSPMEIMVALKTKLEITSPFAITHSTPNNEDKAHFFVHVLDRATAISIHNRHTIELPAATFVRPVVIPETVFDPDFIRMTAKNIDRRTTPAEISDHIREALHEFGYERKNASLWFYPKARNGDVIPTKITLAVKNNTVADVLTEKPWKPYGRTVFWEVDDA